MLVPQLYNITAFDAIKEYTFTFKWTGSQVFGSKLTIRKNEDNTVVYSGIYTSMKQLHSIPENTLENGVCYNAYIEILDSSQNVISEQSNIILFYCYSTPSFIFNNITENFIIENSSYTVVVDYNQPEGEPLSQYQIALYDMDKVVVQTQGIRYASANIGTIQISTTFTGLQSNITYYVRATGKTLNNIEIATEYIPVTVKYIKPAIFSYVGLENVKNGGHISISSNLITLKGEAHVPEEELEYIDGTMVDLRGDGAYIKFTEGFDFAENWKMGGSFLGIPINTPLLSWEEGSKTATLYYREGIFECNNGVLMGYFELQLDAALGISIIISDYFVPIQETDKYTVWIVKKNNLYSVHAVFQSGGESV